MYRTIMAREYINKQTTHVYPGRRRHWSCMLAEHISDSFGGVHAAALLSGRHSPVPAIAAPYTARP